MYEFEKSFLDAFNKGFMSTIKQEKNLPTFYSLCGFGVSICATGEIIIRFKNDDIEFQKVVLPISAAKSLSLDLQKVIEEYEIARGTKVETLAEMKAKSDKIEQEKSEKEKGK